MFCTYVQSIILLLTLVPIVEHWLVSISKYGQLTLVLINALYTIHISPISFKPEPNSQPYNTPGRRWSCWWPTALLAWQRWGRRLRFVVGRWWERWSRWTSSWWRRQSRKRGVFGRHVLRLKPPGSPNWRRRGRRRRRGCWEHWERSTKQVKSIQNFHSRPWWTNAVSKIKDAHRTWRCSSQVSEGLRGLRRNAVFLSILRERVYWHPVHGVDLWEAAAASVPAAAGPHPTPSRTSRCSSCSSGSEASACLGRWRRRREPTLKSWAAWGRCRERCSWPDAPHVWMAALSGWAATRKKPIINTVNPKPGTRSSP